MTDFNVEIIIVFSCIGLSLLTCGVVVIYKCIYLYSMEDIQTINTMYSIQNSQKNEIHTNDEINV